MVAVKDDEEDFFLCISSIYRTQEYHTFGLWLNFILHAHFRPK